MKKALTLILTLILAMSFAACGNKTPSGNENNSGASTPAVAGKDGAPAAGFENKIDLSLDKTHYDQAERIEATMNFADVDQDNAIIAIVSADLPHGQRTPAEEDTEEYRWIADFSEIPFYLWAPEKDGIFDARVYAGGNGEELAFVTFAVGGATLPAGSGNAGGGGTGGVIAGNDGVSTYAEAYKKYAAVYSAMYDAYYAVLEPHNAAIEQKGDYWDDPEHFSDVVTGFANIPIAYTATIGESGYEANVSALFDMFDLKEGSVEELDAANYRMTYLGVYNDTTTWESTEDAPWESLCGFDASKGALYFRQYVTLDSEKKLDSFIECVPLGGGRYALQSKFERGIVEIMDGKAAAFAYAAFNTPFDPEANGIYPDAAGADEAWVTAGDGMYQHITLEADSMHIWADEITDGIMAAPVRDITIAR